ncbi:putative PEP-binding protein [Leptolyngbya sp. FACHB-261]|uniref:putative PEP-binding protein n=1 Tax=Leptolyngbya sp. FACHB-261 TaxID=2692806 RepID=UPI0016883A9F|nr:putative PEP-binding protein [Leptolyngbya sp. FACHB-261]MBD2103471.1 hypothetical protein [Leptolyngbya sp. FACHB-261]
MGYLSWLNQLQPDDLPEVGSKAFNLSQLQQAGYPVPNGFIIGASAYREAIQTIGWPEPLQASQAIELGRPLQEAAHQIRRSIQINLSLPQPLITTLQESIAQLQTSDLILRPGLGNNVCLPLGLLPAQYALVPFRATIEQSQDSQFETKLRQLWASLFSARSLFYWQQRGIKVADLAMTVLVQPVLPALATGWCHWKVKSEAETSQLLKVWAIRGQGIAASRGEAIPVYHQFDPRRRTVDWRPGLQFRYYEFSPEQRPGVAAIRPVEAILKPLTLEVLEDLQFWSQKVSAQLKLALDNTLHLEWVLTLDNTIVLLQANGEMFENDENEQIKLQVGFPLSSNILGSSLTGVGVVKGQVQGQARVLKQELLQPQPGEILVTTAVTPDWLPVISQCAGLVVEDAGLASHAAILARELGIPTVVGVHSATDLIQDGELLMLDGNAGTVSRLNNAGLAHNLHSSSHNGQGILPPDTTTAVTTALTTVTAMPVTGTRLLLSLSQSHLAAQMAALPSEGVGLLRSELLILQALEHKHPYAWLQSARQPELVARLVAGIQPFLAAFAPRPVFYRSLDLRSCELRQLVGGADYEMLELNPALGWRGVVRYQDDPALFKLELQALRQLQQSGYHHLRLLLPFVRTVKEFKFARDLVRELGLFETPGFELWIMAEVPAVIFALPDFVQAGVQGITVGTNDLTQLLLGIDRDQPRLAQRFDSTNPAVVAAVQQLIKQARQLKLPCHICGDPFLHSPELLDDLVRWGITAICVEPANLEQGRWSLAQAEQRLLIEAARRQ